MLILSQMFDAIDKKKEMKRFAVLGKFSADHSSRYIDCGCFN